MRVTPDFNSQTLTMTLTVESSLMNKYFANFKGMVMKQNSISGLEVNQKSKNAATITFPLPKDSMPKPFGGMMSISLNGNDLAQLKSVFDEFEVIARNRERRNIEFIPLDGYSFDEMSEEIKEAVTNKKDLMIIKDFSEFQKSEKTGKCNFNQYRLDYGTSEYADAVIMIWKKQKEALRKMYQDKLVYTEW